MENKPTDKKPTPSVKKKKKRNIWKAIWLIIQVFIVLGLMGGLFTGAVAAGFFASNVKDDPIRDYDEIYSKIHDFNQTGEAYFKNEELIGYLRTAEVSQPITVNEVSPYLIHAILATEDNYFYEHTGINYKSITRAVLEQVRNSGDGTGGSTITQQLVKNQILGPEVTFQRKFKEMLLAMRVERMFNKDEILEAYMNIMYMGYNANGSNIEGVKAASEGIFQAEVKDLNIAQSAYIAGMIHSPGRYTPFKRSGEVSEERFKRGLERMEFVLNRMLTTQRITKDEFDEALAYNLRASLAKPTPGIVEKYPFLTFEIERKAIDILVDQRLEELGIERDTMTETAYNEQREFARRQLSRGGLKVYTTIDRELYEAFHEVASNDEMFGPRSTENKYTITDEETGEEKEIGYLEQTAATLIDNQTGAIIAMVEGRDFNELQYNLNTEPRQPGSSIKPILDYAPALELGLVQPASAIDDAPIFKWDRQTGKYWVPKNWNNQYQGIVSARRAMDMSYNLPAIKTFLKVQEVAGQQVPFDYLRKMGITTLDERDFSAPSVSIGGMTHGLTIEENTNAFATFGNNGNYIKSYLIEKIETMDGDVIFQHELQPEYVFSEQTAFLMNDMLKSVVRQGTATRIHRGMGPELEIAGKTGTTNDKHDYWFIGYTPKVSMGVWFGYEKREPLVGDYSARNQNLWIELMQKVKEIRPELVNEETKFTMPEDIMRRTVCSKSGDLPSDLCREAGFLVEDFFNRKYLPTKVDDSLIKARMIEIDGTRYIAHDQTPDDFVSDGVYIKRDPLDIPEEHLDERNKLLPLDWDMTAPQEIDPREENKKNPDQPNGLNVAVQDSGNVITWHAVADQDNAGYRVYRAATDGQFVHIASIPNHLSKMHLDENVRQGESYAYKVIAVDIAGNESEASQIVVSNQLDLDQFFIPDEPTQPTGLEGRRSVFGVDINWNPNPQDEEVSSYKIYYTSDPVSGFNFLAQTGLTSFTHTFIDAPDQYLYYIIAVNEAGESERTTAIRIQFNQDGQSDGEPDVGSGDKPEEPDDDSSSGSIIDKLP
jgi:penicillin-binding protein